MFTKPRLRYAALLLGAVLAAPTASRADVIDDALGTYDGAQTIFSYLKAKGYKNVGILRFQVQKGKADPTFHADYLNDLMATRLENALIFTQPTKETSQVGITRGATRTAAAADPKSSFTTPEGRTKLFQHTYERAWGKPENRKVKVDAFLTGVIEYAPGFKTARIRIFAFDQASAEKPDAKAFTQVTLIDKNAEGKALTLDRSALRDAGKAFVLTKRSFRFPDEGMPPSPDRVDSSVTDELIPSGDVLTKFQEKLEVKVVMGDRWVGNRLEGETELTLTPSEEGAKLDGLVPDKIVAFKFKAKSKLGLFLVVNGLNSLNKEQVSPGQDGLEFSWWIMDPKEEYYYVRGYTTRKDAATVDQEDFRVVLPDAANRETELGQDPSGWGRFELTIYEEATAVGLEPKVAWKERPADPLRGDVGSADSLVMLKEKIKKGGEPVPRVFVVPGEKRVVNVESTDFTGVLVTSLKIRYYDPSSP